MKILLYLLFIRLICGCSAASPSNPQTNQAESLKKEPRESSFQVIELAGPSATRDSEISGLAWYKDTLILLPQFPSRFATGDDNGKLFAIPKDQIIAIINGDLKGKIYPQEIELRAPGLEHIEGFEGLEALVFEGSRIFSLIEAKTTRGMVGYLIGGNITSDGKSITLQVSYKTAIEVQTNLTNMAYESLAVLSDRRLLAIYEINGSHINSFPLGYLFSPELKQVGKVKLEHIDYRITDVTELDNDGRFWAVNYMWPGHNKLLRPEQDLLFERFGKGKTHQQHVAIERLVEMQWSEEGITLTSTPPIQLKLGDDKEARNWEGIVRLDQRGFLLVTDQYPQTMLVFLPRQ